MLRCNIRAIQFRPRGNCCGGCEGWLSTPNLQISTKLGRLVSTAGEVSSLALQCVCKLEFS